LPILFLMCMCFFQDGAYARTRASVAYVEKLELQLDMHLV
jgi:hypothetical protein